MRQAFRPLIVLLLVVVGMGALVMFSPRQRENSTGKELIPWKTDFDAAKAEAAKSGKPVFAYFGATWCGPCQSLKKTTWADPRVEQALRAYVAVHVDVDDHPDLARRYVPTPSNPQGGIPAFRVLDRDGQVVKELTGAVPPDEFLKWLGEG